MAVKHTLRDQSGFSLIELLIALAILGIVLTGVIVMFTSTGRHHTTQEMMVELTQDVRSAKMLMVDEIRSAGCNPEDKTRIGFLITTGDQFDTDANSIHFTRDIDNGDGNQFYEPDGDADDSNENIAYYRVDTGGNILNPGDSTVGTLVRNTGGGGQPVAENIIDLRFRYFDATDTEIAAATMTTETVLDTIRSVEVFIVGQVMNTTRVSAANQTWTQQFRIRVRNL